jgi:hypothetical protein
MAAKNKAVEPEETVVQDNHATDRTGQPCD